MTRKIKIALFVLALLVLGFFRETLFVSINSALYDKFYNENNNRVAWFLYFLNLFSYQTIYIAKWFITPLFVFVYWFIQRRFLLFLFTEKRNAEPLAKHSMKQKERKKDNELIVRWLSILYLSLFLLAGVFFIAGWVFGKINDGYVFSRLFMGLLQSPAPCMILIPAMYLYKIE